MSGLAAGRVRGLFGIVRRSLRQHLLSTVVTMVSLALGVGLVMAVFTIERQARDAFTGGQSGFDAVLGARGSPLQLVLNTIFHLETSPGNIPWSLYEQVHDDPRVALAVPYAVGDQYEGFRVVGTTPELFERAEVTRGEPFRIRAPGRVFEPERREALVGSFAAARTGLRYGATFQPSHGVYEGVADDVHEEEYVVVGVLEPTNTPNDRVIWIPIDGVLHMEGHVMRGAGEEYHPEPGEEVPDEHKEVSAVLLDLKGGFALASQMASSFNREGTEATMAYPIAASVAQLFDRLGWIQKVLTFVAWLVVAVAAGSVLASIYNTMNERRREFAILRALGARRGTVFRVIVAESATIAAGGALLGFAVHFAVLSVAAGILRAQTGVVIDVLAFDAALVVTPLAVVALGALTGVVPALKAYRTDVATNLLPGA